jgi:methionyl-tRNA formyltransferase
VDSRPPLRLVFVGTGDIALPAFRWLLQHGPKPLALVTQPDKPVGRHQVMTPPRIKEEALAAGIPVLQPETSSDAVTDLAALNPEVIVVMAYGQILRESFLGLASTAIINLHASLLPAYRGSSCIQAAIARGDSETGVTAMHVVRQLDAGDIIHAKRIPIAADETGGTLHDRLAGLAAEVLAETLPMLATGTAPRLPQNPAAVSIVTKLLREHGRIDWNLDATEIERLVRAYDPWPGTYTTFLDGSTEKRLKIFPPVVVEASELSPGEVSCQDGKLLVGCGRGTLEITTVQPEGGRRMSAVDFLKARNPKRLGGGVT